MLVLYNNQPTFTTGYLEIFGKDVLLKLTKYWCFVTILLAKKNEDLNHIKNQLIWGIGAVGSAFDWQSKGQGFESPILHQTGIGRTFIP